MDQTLQDLIYKFEDNDDFFLQRDFFADRPVYLLGLKSLIDMARSRTFIHQYLDQAISNNTALSDGALMQMLGEVRGTNLQDISSSVYDGKFIIYFEHVQQYVVAEPVPNLLSRLFDTPTNENVLQGTLSSFVEDIDHNIGIARKQFSSESLRVKSFSVGQNQQKRIALLFAEGHVDMALVEQIIGQFETYIDHDINHIQDLSRTLGLSPWGSIAKFKTTEMPQEAAHSLKTGKVVIFVDRLPFALVLPNLLWDMFCLDNDHNYSLPLMIVLRSLRIVGVLITLIVPALYVALVAVNPEVLRIEIALTVAQSREGVPYPALVEIILILLILELIMEASVRLPRSIGPTITMVGGIILGEATVAAKLVSNLLIIILAATTIANSTVVGFQNSLSIRLFKYLLLLLAAVYGVLGILAGVVIICAYVASLNTFGVPYISITRMKERGNHG